ncbi:Delta(24)-sterol reductase [Thelotrema lepadinum]|nr:Delta(24)-sterol reductase [Thelotrema lepadinum]
MLFKALHASAESREYIVQDLALPLSTVEAFINYTIESFNIWPLWLCPLRQTRVPTLHPHFIETEADGKTLKPLLNVGLWGYGPIEQNRFVAKNRELEHKLREFGGMKWLYAHTYYEEDEFWEMFDRRWYDDLRRKYHAEFLPSVWQKVKVLVNPTGKAISYSSWTQTWPLPGLLGIRKAIQSGEYLTARNSTWKARDGSTKGK